MISFSCPDCNKRLKAPPDQAGQWIRCPQCRAKFIVPVPPPDVNEPVSLDPVVEIKNQARIDSHDDDEEEEPLSKPPTEINHEELIDMTAMVDIVFFLLIFFLVTSMSGVQSSALLPRPETQHEDGAGKAALNSEPQAGGNEIIVKIAKDDSIEIDGVPFRDIADLTARLLQLRNTSGNDTSMLIIGHGEASHGVAASILDAGYEVGINRLRMSVIDDESE